MADHNPVDWIFARLAVWLFKGCYWAVGKIIPGMERVLPTARPVDMLRNRSQYRREMNILQTLLLRLNTYAPVAEETCRNVARRATQKELSSLPVESAKHLQLPAMQLCVDLLRDEGYFPTLTLDLKINPPTFGEMLEFTKAAERQLLLYERQNTAEQIEGVLSNVLAETFCNYPYTRAVQPDEAMDSLTVPLYALLPKPGETIENFYRLIFPIGNPGGIFQHLGHTLMNNLHIASGIDPHRSGESRKALIGPRQFEGSRAQLVNAFLVGTPFLNLFQTQFSYSLPHESRFEHTHIVAGSGHGKTQLLQNLLLGDLEKIREGKASVVVIDSQGDMIRHILDLALVGEMSERVVYIEPNHIEYPPALNFFDFGQDRLDRYDPVEREKLINGAISLYEYVFGALLGAELSQRQGVIFRYLARLMMVVPGATIQTLMDFMQEPETTRPYIANLDPTAAKFFETQFFSKSFDSTRQQILTRLWSVRSNSVLDRMFANKHNKLNLFAAMNSGSLILINTAKELLKQEGCEILGRFFIALMCQAAQERASIPEDKRQDTFIYIDEAHDYFDESMENLLNQARKYRVGLILAHQNLDQFERKLRSTVISSTSIKMVGGLSSDDASDFAKDMHCDDEFLKGMRKHAGYTEFASYVRNYTESPITLRVPFGSMERKPKITLEKLTRLIAHNRARYCTAINPRRDDPPPPPDLLEPPELL